MLGDPLLFFLEPAGPLDHVLPRSMENVHRPLEPNRRHIRSFEANGASVERNPVANRFRPGSVFMTLSWKDEPV